jgi:hypothetical protein
MRPFAATKDSKDCVAELSATILGLIPGNRLHFQIKSAARANPPGENKGLGRNTESDA